MVEVVYNGETKRPEMPDGQAFGNLKNIRQIGRIGGGSKVYVEDAAMRFLQQRIRQTDPPVIALLGSAGAGEEAASLFVTGAILAEKIEVHGNRLEFAANAFADIYEEAAAYFAESTILGWFLPSYETIGRYADVFGESGRLFLLEEAAEQEEIFYVRRQKQLTKLDGYYIYYQKNEQMQAYRRHCEEEEKKHPQKEENAKNIYVRAWSDVHKRKKEQEKFVDDYKEEEDKLLSDDDGPRLTTFLYAVSTVLAIVILVIGIAMIGSYERMYEMQDTIETIAGSIVSGVVPTEEMQTETDALQNETSGLTETENAGSTGVQAQQTPAAQEVTEMPEEDGNTGEDSVPDISESAAEPAALEAAYRAGTVTVDGSGAMIYTIQEGDTLAAISRQFYQTENQVTQILAANIGLSQNELTEGEKIVLP